MKQLLEKAKWAGRKMALVDLASINRVLLDLAAETRLQLSGILEANQRDLDLMEKSNPMYDRLLLNESRINSICESIETIAALPFPQSKLIQEIKRPNGLVIKKVSVPFGVIGVIYEARPNVSFDVFALCFKSGSACILKGGTDAYQTNSFIVSVLRKVLERNGFLADTVQLMPPGRECTEALLNAVGYVDLIIPRGSQGLITSVRNQSKIPVIETGIGVCHIYVDKDVDLSLAEKIITNSKTRRVSVCNAMECLLVHRSHLKDLPSLCRGLADHNVHLFLEQDAQKALWESYPRDLLSELIPEEHFGREFLDYKLALRIVDSIEEAVEHISAYGSKHSECIASTLPQSIAFFQASVDAACVYSNAATSFTDGGEFGFGAEIGISTQKLHARGPMALPELTSYKWIIEGNGQTRS